MISRNQEPSHEIIPNGASPLSRMNLEVLENSHGKKSFLFSPLLSSASSSSIWTAGKLNFFFFFSLPGVADRMVWKRVVVSSGCDFDRGELESRIRNLLMYVYFVFFFLSFFYFCKRFSREKVKKKKKSRI